MQEKTVNDGQKAAYHDGSRPLFFRERNFAGVIFLFLCFISRAICAIIIPHKGGGRCDSPGKDFGDQTSGKAKKVS